VKEPQYLEISEKHRDHSKNDFYGKKVYYFSLISGKLERQDKSTTFSKIWFKFGAGHLGPFHLYVLYFPYYAPAVILLLTPC
jgi:hypothetical protein